MLKTKIKTHKLGTTYNQPHFFILNKGYNSGKPCPQYWSNCFVFLADDEEERGFYYFLIQGLWELGFFKPHLMGSVVKYIRIDDLIDIVEETVNAVNSGERKFSDVQNTLARIEETKIRLQTKINYLLTIRKSIFYSHLKK
jgi:hypothetical protein